MDLTQILTAYKDYGVAGLFIVFYVITVRQFYLDLKDQKKEIVTMTEKYATSLDQANNAVNRATATMDNVARVITESKQQTSEFIAFIKGRDAGKGGQ